MGMSSTLGGSALGAADGLDLAGQLAPGRGELAELLDEHLRRARERLLGRDGAVGLDLEGQLVVVGDLADAGVLDVVVDPADGREDGVHRDDPDGQALLGVVGGQVARAPLDGQVHLDGGARLEGQDVLLGVDDLDVGRLHDVGRGDRAGPALDELELGGMRARSP